MGPAFWTDWVWSSRPSLVLSRELGDLSASDFAGRDFGELKWLAALYGVSQDPKWHPEGDALQHTLCVCDAAARVCEREGLAGYRRWSLMLAALCHDYGKALTTRFDAEKQKWTAYGHEFAGVPLARDFCRALSVRSEIEEAVCHLTLCHMAHCRPKGQWTEKAVRKFFLQLAPATLEDLLLLMEADCAGRGEASGPLPQSLNEMLETAFCLDLAVYHRV